MAKYLRCPSCSCSGYHLPAKSTEFRMKCKYCNFVEGMPLNLNVSPPVSVEPVKITDAHTEHCCTTHGCKYGSENWVCSVVSEKLKQSFPCEMCDMDAKETLRNLESLKKLLRENLTVQADLRCGYYNDQSVEIGLLFDGEEISSSSFSLPDNGKSHY